MRICLPGRIKPMDFTLEHGFRTRQINAFDSDYIGGLPRWIIVGQRLRERYSGLTRLWKL